MSTATIQQQTRTVTIAATGAPGRPGLVWDDAGWQAGVTYAAGVALQHHGTSWRALATHIGGGETEPGVGAAWQEAWAVLAHGADPALMQAAIAAASEAVPASETAQQAAATAMSAREDAMAHAEAAAASAAEASLQALRAGAHALPIGLLLSDNAALADGGWHVCRDYPATARLTRLRLEVLAGNGDAGNWFIEVDGSIVVGPIALASDAPIILGGLVVDLAPGSEVIAWRSGGGLAPPFAILLQIDGRAP